MLQKWAQYSVVLSDTNLYLSINTNEKADDDDNESDIDYSEYLDVCYSFVIVSMLIQETLNNN